MLKKELIMLLQIQKSQKFLEQFLVCGEKWLWPLMFWVSKIDFISRKNWWIKLIFLHFALNLQKPKVTLIILGWEWPKMGMVNEFMWL